MVFSDLLLVGLDLLILHGFTGVRAAKARAGMRANSRTNFNITDTLESGHGVKIFDQNQVYIQYCYRDSRVVYVCYQY